MRGRRYLVVAVAGALAGCGTDTAALVVDADPTIDAPPPREVVTAIQPLRAGELVEGIMNGGPGDLAVIHLAAPNRYLDWNIHGHANGGTQIVYEQLRQMTVTYNYTPTSKTDWWLLLRNSGPTNMDVMVTVELHGEMTWRWQ